MMNDLKERALIILIILLFSFWYVLQTVKRMKNGEY